VGSSHIKPEDEAFKKLQKENKELKEKNEILKKAVAYFAKNQK
jgi:transposase